MKINHGAVLLLVKMQEACNFSKGITPPFVFLRHLRFYVFWIVQMVPNHANYHKYLIKEGEGAYLEPNGASTLDLF